MRKVIIIFIAICLAGFLLVLTNHLYSAEDKDVQSESQTDYMQKYYKKLAEEQEEQAKKAKDFEPTTPLSKFIGKFVSSFLIISLVIVFFGWILVHALAEDEIWATLLKWYSLVTVYFLINYMVWFILKIIKNKYIDIISALTLAITAILFIFPAFFLHRQKVKSKKESQPPTWRCPKCDVTNHYNDVCWNCHTKKSE